MVTKLNGLHTNGTDVRRYEAREIILYPDAVTNLYQVHSGLVRIHTVDNEGNALTLRYVKPDGYFGEEALIGVKRRYFAEAVTTCDVSVISPATLGAEELALLNHHFATAMEKLYRSMFRLSGKRLKARIAAELLDLQDSALASPGANGEAIIRLTHDDLAAAVGSVRETVTKIVGELTRENAIHSGYGKITLTDIKLLQTIADA